MPHRIIFDLNGFGEQLDRNHEKEILSSGIFDQKFDVDFLEKKYCVK